jgi:RNA polymerase sigma-70 factor (ECF subfamily)
MVRNEVEERLTRMWVEHAGVVAAYARRRLPEPEVDDLVIEVFVAAWQRLSTGDGESRPWILGIARNIVLHHQRSHGRRAALAERAAAQPMAPPPTVEEGTIARVDLLRAWAALSEEEREVLALAAWDGLTSAEAAKVLGCARSAYSMRMIRARRRLESLAGHPMERSS